MSLIYARIYMIYNLHQYIILKIIYYLLTSTTTTPPQQLYFPNVFTYRPQKYNYTILLFNR